jgi:hypothetical protein
VNAAEILKTLHELTERKEIEFLPFAKDLEKPPQWLPAARYIQVLSEGTKPETASEDLFTALCKELLKIEPSRQVIVRDGWVDFRVTETNARPIPFELKSLFRRDGDSLRRYDANPDHYKDQIKNYLSEHEYLVLTDLRTTWLCSARDYFFEDKPFAAVPFTDFLLRCIECRSITDALRRFEDTTDKPELEQQFFEDLKNWFGEFDKIHWQAKDQAAEFIILLINKLIFAKTLEDFGLVSYRFIQNEFAVQKDRWEAKGPAKVAHYFLKNFEDFFDEYYDTEIFEERIWDKLVADDANFDRFCKKLEFILGLDPWNTAMGRGIVNYNYRRIDEDIFGKSYEMFLAANRKDEGIYYTPAGITGPMADSLVNSLAGKIVDEICAAVGRQKCNFASADKLMAQLAEIRVADTACGSGGFLIKVLRAFWRQYKRVDDASAWVHRILKPESGEMLLAELPPNVDAALGFRRRHAFDDRRVLIARILLRHIYGADKDAGALEVAKTNIWKEAVKLSAADYNYRALKGDIVKILPNLELNFVSADSLVDVELPKQVEWLAEYHQAELKKLSELRARYIENPMRHEALEEALKLRDRVRANFNEHFQGENLPCEPGGFALHFWPCWFNANGGRAQAPGFDGIIGNPPWEGFKPFRKEFAASFYRGKPQFSKMGMDGPTFNKWFEQELETNAEFAARWHEHEEYYERHKDYLGKSYKHQGTGDWNLFKLFIERDLSLVRQAGQFSLLVPSSIQTDEGCADLRRWFITEHRLDELTSFENRGYTELIDGREQRKKIFPDVHPQFKFGFFKIVKGAATPKDHAFDARFYLHDPKNYCSIPIRYAVEMIRRFSPENQSFMEFRSATDYILATKIRGDHRLLVELDYPFQRELHMTDDNHLFIKLGAKKVGKGQLPLYEGKMIYQFDAHFSPATLVVEEAVVREELLRKEIFRLCQFIRESDVAKVGGKKVPEKRDELEVLLKAQFEAGKFKLHYEFERLGTRDVGSSTNERTLIAAVMPPRVCIGNTINFLRPFRYSVDAKSNLQQQELDGEEMRALLCLLDSLVLNYYVRNKVSAHVNIHQLNELPLPKLTAAQKKKLADFAGRLLNNPRDVKERAALEIFIARELYSLSLEDWKHLTGTFTFGSGETKAELDEIIRQSLAHWQGA